MTDHTHTDDALRRQITPGAARPVEPGMSRRDLTIDSVKLISIEDTLGCAKTRCAALMMAAEALAERSERDAMSWLAEDADHIINLAIDAIEALRGEVQP
ncbi:hypothetical protein [Devosia alba]|uniref:hypothetical protein n=1 Tax=Devosia alba TaxID=3152360 RepID=UPI003267458A